MGVEPKIGGFTPKMDGEDHGKPYFLMDDLGGTTILGDVDPWNLITNSFRYLKWKVSWTL